MEYLLQHCRYCSSVGIVLFLYAEAFVPAITGYFFTSWYVRFSIFLSTPHIRSRLESWKITNVPSFSCRTSVSTYSAPLCPARLNAGSVFSGASRLNPLCRIIPVFPFRGVLDVPVFLSWTYTCMVFFIFFPPSAVTVIFTRPGAFAVIFPVLDTVTALLDVA